LKTTEGCDNAPAAAPEEKTRKKRKHGANILNVEDARLWIDGITKNSYLPKRFLPAALCCQILNGIRMKALLSKK
jgi:hypothetical protein